MGLGRSLVGCSISPADICHNLGALCTSCLPSPYVWPRALSVILAQGHSWHSQKSRAKPREKEVFPVAHTPLVQRLQGEEGMCQGHTGFDSGQSDSRVMSHPKEMNGSAVSGCPFGLLSSPGQGSKTRTSLQGSW